MKNKKNTSTTQRSLGERMRNHQLYPVAYMFAITFFFVVILIGVATATRERVEANQQIRVERALLMAALPDQVDRRTPSLRVNEIYTRRVKPPGDPRRELFEVVDEENDGQVVAYALQFEGQGYWDEIGGFLALEPDRETVIGIAFFQQHETPGLGARIETPEFREQFQGITLADRERAVAVISPVDERDKHSVHAITGATQTSVRLERIINTNIAAWRDAANRNEDSQGDRR